ncbi:MAG: peptidylprolyl isomerase [Candidatus Thermoplasmatota archaeon]|nr:peptidylprolyl isomerase [Candidatus Thermoplasmatota archaeon]
MPAQEGDKVRVHYTGTLPDGSTFDSSVDRDPLEFTLGQGQMIPGFEELVLGLEPGQSKTETLPAEKAYGPHREDLVRKVSKEQLAADFDLEEGDRIRLQPPQGGQPMDALITEIQDKEVFLDLNHPLAGEDLTFEVELVEIV